VAHGVELVLEDAEGRGQELAGDLLGDFEGLEVPGPRPVGDVRSVHGEQVGEVAGERGGVHGVVVDVLRERLQSGLHAFLGAVEGLDDVFGDRDLERAAGVVAPQEQLAVGGGTGGGARGEGGAGECGAA
jgi:hypothetical protein